MLWVSMSIPAALLAGLAGAVSGAVLWWAVPHRAVRQARRRGFLVDEPVAVTVAEEGLTVDRGGRERRLVWSAVQQVEPGPRHLYLHLGGAQAFAIPRRALGDRATQAGFVAQIRSWRDGPSAPALPEDPDPGRDVWVLGYRLVIDDYVMFTRVLTDEQRRRRPLVMALMAALTGGVLLASVEPWHGGVNPGMLGLMALFSLALVAIGLAPLWLPPSLTSWWAQRTLQRSPGRMPEGPVVLGLGPEGGWLRSSRGVSRFGWDELLRVHSDADQLLLLFSDQEGVIVPGRAFDDPDDQDELVAQVEDWQREALALPDVRRREHGGPRRAVSMANPFEPPGGV